jgi:hypothetical protein
LALPFSSRPLPALGSLRGYAQRDPLVEYKLEGYNLFVEMMAQIRRNVIFNVSLPARSHHSMLAGWVSVLPHSGFLSSNSIDCVLMSCL